MSELIKSPQKLAFLLVAFMALTAVSMFMLSRVEAATSTLGAQSARIGVGQTAALPIVLSDAPNGFAGLDIVVTLSNPSVASIVGAELPGFGLTLVDLRATSEVHFRAVDVNGIVEPGAIGATLATLTVLGEKNGSTDILISIVRLDDEYGSPIITDVLTATVGVKKNAGGKGGGGGGGDKGGNGKGRNK